MNRPDTAHISRLHFPVTTLGPGKRLGIWFQGCSIRCAGCISTDTWAHGRQEITFASLFAVFDHWLDVADGVTITGGEPLEQPDSLIITLEEIRRRRPAKLDILLFTGFTLEAAQPFLHRASGLLDAIISDPYDANAPATLALRGSDNQRLTILTDLGRARFADYERTRTPKDKAFDVMFDSDGTVWLAGIPDREEFRRLASILADTGTRIVTTQGIGGDALEDRTK